MDPAMFERIEIIRGPASAIYGDSAFFAVVNVITRTGASLGGASTRSCVRPPNLLL
jgi:outer membrane receptor for ferrienterochelin and colicin